MGLTHYFRQLLSPQWNTGEFGADSAETPAQDPLGLFAVGRDILVSTEKTMTPWKVNRTPLGPDAAALRAIG